MIWSGFLIQIGLALFYSSNSVLTSLTFFFFFSFGLSSFSSLISGSSPSFFSFSSPSYSSFLVDSSSSSSSLISLSVVFSTYNSIGKAINSECFLIKSLSLLSSKNSKLSLFKWQMISVPLVIWLGFSLSSVTVKVPPADDSHLHYLSSSLDFETTVTFSETR